MISSSCLKTFSFKNEGFGILKNKKGFFLIFFLKTFLVKNKGFKVLKAKNFFDYQRLFVEERRIQSSKN